MRVGSTAAFAAAWAVALVPPASGAETKEEIRDRSAEICAHSLLAVKPHAGRAERAARRYPLRRACIKFVQ